MCGIIGVWGENLPKDLNFEEMLSKLSHRGPDDRGIVKEKNLILGHQRLAIMDVRGARQPLQNKQNDLLGICNGEIYNYKELRQRIDSSYSFNSFGDSEVILPLYQELGAELTKHLDGMFSFVVSDGKELIAARDPIGIKPLYYGDLENCRLFSSEIKAIVKYTDSIREFPQGHYYQSEKGFFPYYRIPENSEFSDDVEAVLENIRQSLRLSVKKRLMSDVPVGVFLSGGLDSSVIAALMAEFMPELHSFSVGLANSPDLKAARKVAEHLGSIHHEYVYNVEEMKSILADVIYYLESYDPALVRSAIPCYLVSRLASQYVKVVLSGEGADELFAGYSYLNDYDEAIELHQESISLIQGLHNLNLQRVDRMTMAHSLEGRVPFLDREFIAMSLSIDPKLKLQKTYGIEKWLLRKAFAEKLPSEIVWRDKMEFAQGCASSTILAQLADSSISQTELEAAKLEGCPVTNKEELLYYRIFQKHFQVRDVGNLIGKWQGNLH